MVTRWTRPNQRKKKDLSHGQDLIVGSSAFHLHPDPLLSPQTCLVLFGAAVTEEQKKRG